MGKLTEAIRKLVESLQITSASPGHINEVLQFDPTIDLDEIIKEEVGEKGVSVRGKGKKEDKLNKNLQDIADLSSNQFANIKQIALNPFGFIINNVLRKAAKGAGIIALAFVFFEVVKFIINELLKPGRPLDRRFKRDIQDEFLVLRDREEKQELLVGTRSIIVTTIGNLRGGEGQISSNLRALAGLQPQPVPRNFVNVNTAQASGIELTVAKRLFRAGR